MTTFATPITLPLTGVETDTRVGYPTRDRARVAGRRPWARKVDGKVEMLRAVQALDGCGTGELNALARSADLVHVPAGTVLAEGAEFSRQWWMPIEGWLLVEGDGNVSRTIPAGSSWTAPRIPALGGRITALRDTTTLVAALPHITAALYDYPRLGSAIRASLVGGDV